MKLAILFDNFGPYHQARLRAASEDCILLAIQAHRHSRDYAWQPSPPSPEFQHLTLSSCGCSQGSRFRHFRRLRHALSQFAPHCVFVPGWSSPYSLAALSWCNRNEVPAVLMSESTEQDCLRASWKEFIKSRIVRACSAALVGGSAHVEYLARLGMERERIFKGYDVVDNHYFSEAASVIRSDRTHVRHTFGLPQNYFLASARFIPSKNLPYLITEYAGYREAVTRFEGPVREMPSPWSLVLLGDGPARRELEQLVAKLRLEEFVLLPGFRQYTDLPLYYASAGVFVHASTSEPWGLVVNEAMASGLPVLVSERCGCARDLVRPDLNGFTFDPTQAGKLAELMLKLSGSEALRRRMGRVSLDLISGWGPSRFREGLQDAARTAITAQPSRSDLSRQLLLQCLFLR